MTVLRERCVDAFSLFQYCSSQSLLSMIWCLCWQRSVRTVGMLCSNTILFIIDVNGAASHYSAWCLCWERSERSVWMRSVCSNTVVVYAAASHYSAWWLCWQRSTRAGSTLCDATVICGAAGGTSCGWSVDLPRCWVSTFHAVLCVCECVCVSVCKTNFV